MNPGLVPMVTGTEVAFWVCAPLMVLGALGLVFFKKAVYSALSMAFVMLNLAVLYGAMDAQFLVWVQVIVYTGAIMMLFLFVMMLVGVDTPDSVVETIKGQKVAAIIAVIALAGLLIFGIGGSLVGKPVGLAEANAGGNVQGIASLLFGRYVFVFELTSALLITAALAAMILAHRTRVVPKAGQSQHAQQRMAAYAASGEHPGALPSSGVFAQNNSIAMPALLPDGSVARKSVSQTLVLRGAMVDPEAMRKITNDAFASIEAVRDAEEDE